MLLEVESANGSVREQPAWNIIMTEATGTHPPEEEVAMMGANPPAAPRPSPTLLMTKDIACISTAFFFLFTSFQSIANLQSSINVDFGTVSLSTIYAAALLSSLFVPTWLIKMLGLRASMVCSMVCYLAYIAVQFKPTPYTLIPSAALLGAGAAPLWAAQSSYFTRMASLYATVSGESKDVVITRFFAIFFGIFQSSQIVGNLISSTVLRANAEPIEVESSQLERCGACFSGSGAANLSLSDQVSITERYTMTGIYLAIACLSPLLIILFVNPLNRYKVETKVSSTTTTVDRLLATLRQMKLPKQLLISPLPVYNSMQHAFMTSDYLAAFVSCGGGVHLVGYTMVCFASSDVITSLLCSPVVKKVGRIPVFCFAALLNVILIIFLLLWMPSSNQLPVLFLVAVLWGVGQGIWQTQTRSLYGVLFHRGPEAAFSCLQFFGCCGYIASFVLSSLVSVAVKLYMLLGMLVCNMTGYLAVEYLERRRSNKGKENDAKLMSS